MVCPRRYSVALALAVGCASPPVVPDAAAPEPAADAAWAADAAAAHPEAMPPPPDRAPPDAPPPPAPDAAAPTDAAPADAAPTDVAPELVPLFVAQGALGRTTVSCDDGRTWTANHSDDDRAVCFTGGLDCDHNPGAGRGIDHGNGWFVATFGWGPPGAIRRSRDGATWEAVTVGTTFAGVAFGNDQFLAGGRPAWIGDGDGSGWRKTGDPALKNWNVRRTAFLPHAGGRFIVHGDGDTLLSSDGGKSWWRPTTLPPDCGTDQWSGGIAYGSGVILMASAQGVACRSTDGGTTFTSAPMGGTVRGRLLWTGSEFMTWGQRGLYRSRDGAAWTTQPTAPPNLLIGPVARSDGGTFVAVKEEWQQWYDKQEFYRSRDGVTWEVLPRSAYAASHPISFISFGRGLRPAACR